MKEYHTVKETVLLSHCKGSIISQPVKKLRCKRGFSLDLIYLRFSLERVAENDSSWVKKRYSVPKPFSEGLWGTCCLVGGGGI